MWSLRKASKVLAGLVLAAGCMPVAAQNSTNSAIDPRFFDQGNLTTVDIAYNVHTGCGPASNVTTVRRRVSYRIRGGLALIGDTVFGTEADLRAVIVGSGNSSVVARNPDNVLSGEHLLVDRALSPWPNAMTPWPNGRIPYTFSNLDWSVDPPVPIVMTAAEIEDRKNMFRLAAKTWMEKLPWLNIFEINDQLYDPFSTSAPTRLTISPIPGCVSWSPVGRANRQVWSVLAIGCPGLWVYLHEIGHSTCSFPFHFSPGLVELDFC